jgi:hypothetical protein
MQQRILDHMLKYARTAYLSMNIHRLRRLLP